MVETLTAKMLQAKEGRKIWITLEREYNIDYDKIVYIMPHNDVTLNQTCIAYKNEVLESKRAKELLIIISETAKNSIQGCDEKVVVITDEEMDYLMKYNDMTEFSSQCFIISFTYGSDHDVRYLQNLGYAKEELIAVGILNLKDILGDTYA